MLLFAALATYSRPSPSSTSACGDARPVTSPAMVVAGVTFPLAPYGYSRIELSLALATNTRPSGAIATAVVPFSPVVAPASVVNGAASPEAPSAYEWIALLPPLMTYTAGWMRGFTAIRSWAVALNAVGVVESVTNAVNEN